MLDSAEAAFLLMLVLDLVGKLTIPLWIAGPIAGAVGIGARELLDKGMGILGLGSAGVKEIAPVENAAAASQKPS